MWTEEQTNKFWTDGVVTNIPLLSEEQCNRIINDYKYFTVSMKGVINYCLIWRYSSNK